MATGAAMECNMSRMMILDSLFVKIGVSFRCDSHFSEAWYTKNPGEHTLGDFSDFKLEELTADSRALGAIFTSTHAQ